MAQVENSLTEQGLMNFIVGTQDIKKIDAYLNRFNPIEIMGMADMEIRHSKILAWLLNPRENHGLGESFLRDFLQKAFKKSEQRTFQESGFSSKFISSQR